MARRTSRYPSLSSFFGLTSEYRIGLFTQIHEIVFYGNGGYDWDTVYNMPIWLRKFTFNKIQEHFNREQEKIEKQNKILKNSSNSSNKIKRPTFTTKASK